MRLRAFWFSARGTYRYRAALRAKCSAPFPGHCRTCSPVHRGGALEVPENTLAGVRHAIAVEADWIEIDVTLSSDDQVVVIHDTTLERDNQWNRPGRKEEAQRASKLTAGKPGLSIKTTRKTKVGGH